MIYKIIHHPLTAHSEIKMIPAKQKTLLFLANMGNSRTKFLNALSALILEPNTKKNQSLLFCKGQDMVG